MEKIDVGELLSKHAPKMQCSTQEYQQLKSAMIEACNLTVDLCEQNAEVAYDIVGITYVDSFSILKVKDQIE